MTRSPMAAGGLRRALFLALTAGSLGLAPACSGLTDVDTPDIVQPEQLANAAGAEALTNGALAALYPPFVTFVYNTGVFSDEFNLPTPFTTFLALDYRTQALTFTEYIPLALHQARVQAQNAIEARRQFAPTPRSRTGQLFAVKGFAELFLGEVTCNGTPLTDIIDLTPVWGGPITSDSMLKRAVASFDSALLYSTDSARVSNYVRVGRGRALLNLGRFADAATAVNAVPTNHVFNAELTATVAAQSNTVWQNNNTRTISVSNREGTNGLDFVTATDPRVVTQSTGLGTDGQTQTYLLTKYTSLGSPISVATGIEARLIEAEAALQANRNDTSPTGTGWLGILNALRAAAITPALPPLTSPGTFDDRVNLLFRERAFWLFATGHRMGDLRRLLRQYARTENRTWPTGVYKAGVNYGTDVVFILTLSEQSNPAGRQCLNRNP
ncbi:MAG: hypothetical protein ACT4P7_02545 [Gemmatimonadaceae bacterium]